MAAAAADGAVRGRRQVSQPALLGTPPRRAAGGPAGPHGHGRRDRARRGRRPRGRPGLPVARRTARRPLQLPAGERRRSGPPDDRRGVLSRLLRLRAEHPARDRAAARGRAAGRRSRSCSPSGAARASRCGLAFGATSGGSSELATKNAELALVTPPRTPSAGSCAASPRSKSCARRSTSRACPCASSASTSRRRRATDGRLDGGVPGRQPRKALYRKFAIRRLPGRQDDYAALGEVLSRRFARAGVPASAPTGTSRSPRFPTSSWSTGEGDSCRPRSRRCTSTSCRGSPSSRSRSGRSTSTCPASGARSCSTAPRRAAAPPAHPRRGSPLRRRLPPPEADAEARDSLLDHLRGVGPARRRALLNHFGSVDRILDASQEELEGVPGLPEKTARAVYAQLHKAGPTVTGARIPRVSKPVVRRDRRRSLLAAGCGGDDKQAGADACPDPGRGGRCRRSSRPRPTTTPRPRGSSCPQPRSAARGRRSRSSSRRRFPSSDARSRRSRTARCPSRCRRTSTASSASSRSHAAVRPTPRPCGWKGRVARRASRARADRGARAATRLAREVRPADRRREARRRGAGVAVLYLDGVTLDPQTASDPGERDDLRELPPTRSSPACTRRWRSRAPAAKRPPAPGRSIPRGVRAGAGRAASQLAARTSVACRHRSPP